MADELKIDTTVFRDAAAALRTIRDEFTTAENNSAATAAVVEHAKLGEKITDFASNWDSKRVEYAESIEILLADAEKIADTFETAEEDIRAQAQSLGEER
ncbi:hypothetical protein ACX3O0_14105 [Homoserinimonas sp. A447]